MHSVTSLSVPVGIPPDTRLDRFLADQLTEFSRSRLQSLIADGHITCNGQPAKARQAVRAGDIVQISLPESKPTGVLAQDIPLDILFADNDLVVLNKVSGMVVHPAVGNDDGTLVNALLHHFGPLSTLGGLERPGIVHRLDKETSGLMVIARNDATHQALANQFADRQVTKKYLAVVHGIPNPAAAEIRTQMGRHPVNRQKRAVLGPDEGKPAATDYCTLLSKNADSSPTSLVCCHLHTGRTHQIRVHLHHIGHAILGDPTYGNPRREPRATRLMLHAWQLAFTHPSTREVMKFQNFPPAEFSPWCPNSGWEAELHQQ